MDKAVFHAKAGIGYISGTLDTDRIRENLCLSDRTLRNCFLSFYSMGIVRPFEAPKTSTDSKVRAVIFHPDIALSISETLTVTPTASCNQILKKRLTRLTGLNVDEINSLSYAELLQLYLCDSQKRLNSGKKCKGILPEIGLYGKKCKILHGALGKKCKDQHSQISVPGKKCKIPQGVTGKKCKTSLEKNVSCINKDLTILYKSF
ncbi:MAG: hypothetical protein ACI4UM_09730 [Succinivibrio sp.]